VSHSEDNCVKVRVVESFSMYVEPSRACRFNSCYLVVTKNCSVRGIKSHKKSYFICLMLEYGTNLAWAVVNPAILVLLLKLYRNPFEAIVVRNTHCIGRRVLYKYSEPAVPIECALGKTHEGHVGGGRGRIRDSAN